MMLVTENPATAIRTAPAPRGVTRVRVAVLWPASIRPILPAESPGHRKELSCLIAVSISCRGISSGEGEGIHPVRRLLLIGLVCGVVLALGGAASAQSGSEAIRSYDVRIAIQKDGSLSVVEVIDYDFATFQHHGIYRDIPVRFKWNGRFDRVYPVHDIEVQGSPGTPDGFKT